MIEEVAPLTLREKFYLRLPYAWRDRWAPFLFPNQRPPGEGELGETNGGNGD